MSESGESNAELARAQHETAALGCDLVLLASVANVTYVSGFEVPFPIGASAEMAFGPPLALFAARETASWLVAARPNVAAAQQQSRLEQMVIAEAFDTFQDIDPKRSSWGRCGSRSRRLGPPIGKRHSALRDATCRTPLPGCWRRSFRGWS
jgi:Xaa-Pro aminopeptidase